MGVLESLKSASPLHLAGYFFGAYVLLLIFYRVRLDYYIRKIGGVRAPMIASNPITGMHAPPFNYAVMILD